MSAMQTMDTKRCTKCKETKPVSLFSRTLYKGYQSWCKACCNQLAIDRTTKRRLWNVQPKRKELRK